MRRYPLASLVEASGLTEAALGRAVGLSGSTLKRARTEGLTEAAADRYTVRAGLTPLEVWPDWGQVPCAHCGGLFAPRRAGHRYCRTSCVSAAWKAKRYATDAAYAELLRQRQRDYYAETARAQRLKEAARYRANPEPKRQRERERYRRRKEEAA